MAEEEKTKTNLLDTTDCLEAVGVFRCWKNFLFVIAILCLLLLQACFWLVNTGLVKTGEKAQNKTPAVVAEQTEQIEKAAKQVATEPNETEQAIAPPEEKKILLSFGINSEHLAWMVRFFDFVLIFTAILYCLTMLFSLKVSLTGRLGGINHICRAFFLSLIFAVLVLPWQKLFGGIVAGAIWTPKELFSPCDAVETGNIFSLSLFYLRFVGYWIVVMLLVIFAQLRSGRWAKAILRRLEIV